MDACLDGLDAKLGLAHMKASLTAYDVIMQSSKAPWQITNYKLQITQLFIFPRKQMSRLKKSQKIATPPPLNITPRDVHPTYPCGYASLLMIT